MNSIILTLSWLAGVRYTGGSDASLLLASLVGILATVFFAPSEGHKTAGRAAWRFAGFDPVALLLFVSLGLSSWFSILPSISIDTMLSIAGLPLVYWATRCALIQGFEWSDQLRPMAFAGAVVVAIAIPEFLIQHQRPFSTFADANVLSAFFNILFIPLYISTLANWQAGLALGNQKLRLTGLLLLLFAIAASTSLGGQLCLAGGLGLVTIIAGCRQSKTWCALALVLAAFIPAYLFANHYAAGRDAASRIATLNEQGSFTERVEMVKSTLAIYSHGPWYGSGIGMYKTLYPAFRSIEERSTTGDLAHNDYVQFLAEGGPLLLGSLLALLGFTLWRNWQLLRLAYAEPINNTETLKTAGYAIAVLCLLMHAVMNFIFYALPLSMVIGLYLARVEFAMLGKSTTAVAVQIPSRLPRLLSGVLIAFLLIALAPRALFVALTTDTCKLRVCNEQRNKGTAGLALANMIAIVQPTWLPARDYLVARLKQEAARTTDPEKKNRVLEAAAQELVSMIEDAPVAYYSYSMLAGLIEETPSLANVLPKGVPYQPAELYRMALDRYPQDQQVRLGLAKAMEAQGKAREAFDLVNEDGMRWWQTLLVPDASRVAMLRYMIPRAIRFGLCEEAQSMAGSLLIFVPTSPLAKSVSGAIDTETKDEPHCGIADSLPSE